jgi:hypothetical protein
LICVLSLSLFKVSLVSNTQSVFAWKSLACNYTSICLSLSYLSLSLSPSLDVEFLLILSSLQFVMVFKTWIYFCFEISKFIFKLSFSIIVGNLLTFLWHVYEIFLYLVSFNKFLHPFLWFSFLCALAKSPDDLYVIRSEKQFHPHFYVSLIENFLTLSHAFPSWLNLRAT